jgi:hypothetical protein
MPSDPPYSHPPVTYGASYPQQLSAVPPPPPSNTANNYEQQVPPPSYSIFMNGATTNRQQVMETVQDQHNRQLVILSDAYYQNQLF